MFILKLLSNISKLIKAFNSECNPNQIAFGVCFGLLLGLTPFSLPQNILLLFIVLCFRINLAAMTLSTIIFSLLSFIITPLSEPIGAWLLTNKFSSLWEMLYNLPIIPLSKFNNTAIMGNTFLAVILFFPLFFLVRFGTKNYREAILRWTEKSNFMKKFYEKFSGETHPGLIRWKGVIAFVIIIGLITGFWIFLINSISKEKIEFSCSKMVGAKVDISSLNVSLSKLEIDLKGLDVTNPDKPMTNIFSTKSMKCRIQFKPLLYGRLVVEDVSISGLYCNTPRKTSGALKKSLASEKKESPLNKKMQSLKEKYSKLPLVELIKDLKDNDLKALVEKANLKSVKESQKLRNDIEAKRLKWQKNINNLPQSKDIEGLNKEVERLSRTNYSNPRAVVDALKKVRKYQKDISRWQQNLIKINKSLGNDFGDLKSRSVKVYEYAKDDVQSVEKQLPFSKQNMKDLGVSLLGKDVVEELEKLTKILATIRRFLPKASPKKEKQEIKKVKSQGSGYDVEYPISEQIPLVWLKLIHLSLPNKKQERLGFSGEIKNLSSHPNLLKSPIEGDIDLAFKEGRAKSGKLKFRWKDKGIIYLNAHGYKIQDKKLQVDLPVSATLKSALANLKMKCSIDHKNSKILVKIDLYNMDLTCNQKADNLAPMQKLIVDTLSKLRKVQFLVSIVQKGKDVDISIKTSLDGVFEKLIRQQIESKMEKSKKRIRELTLAKIKEERKKSEKQFHNLTGIRGDIKERRKALRKLEIEVIKAIKKLTGVGRIPGADKIKVPKVPKLKKWFE